MDTEQIISALKAERERLERAIGVLQDGSRGVAGRPGIRRSRRKMSAAARARISAAQKKRWAARKAQKKK